MQRRWAEWATVGFLAFYFSLPFWEFNAYVAYLAGNWIRYSMPASHTAGWWPYFTLALLAVIQIWTFVAMARFALAMVQRKWGALRLQLQLRTLWILTVVASILLFLNLKGQWGSDHVLKYGFPVRVRRPGSMDIGLADIVRLHTNLFVLLTILGCLAALCELVLWRRTGDPKTQPEPVASMESSTLQALTTREKWFAAIPLSFLFTLIWSCGIPIFCVPHELSYYRDLSAFSLKLQAFVALCEKYYLTAIVLMIFAAWGFFQFACRERRNVRRVNRVVWVAVYLLLFSLSMTLTEAYFPSPRGMRKK